MSNNQYMSNNLYMSTNLYKVLIHVQHLVTKTGYTQSYLIINNNQYIATPIHQ